MSAAVDILNILLPVLYLATFILYLFDFIKDESQIAKSKKAALFITCLLHVSYLVIRTVEFNHPPITTKFEMFTVLAFSITCSYFILEMVTGHGKTGAFFIVFALIFQVISSLFIQDLLEVKEVLRNRMLGLHVISALLGYAGITISAVYGLLYLALYKEIKLSKFGLIFERLPSLETLEKLSFNAVVIGFILFSVSVIIGFVWLPDAFPGFSYWDPKIVTTALVWTVYGAGITAKIAANWYGKKIIIFSVTGFVIAMLSLLASTFVSSSFHTFN